MRFFSVDGKDSRHAIRFPIAGWPAGDIIFPKEEPKCRHGYHFPKQAHLRDLCPTHCVIRVQGVDPAPAAPAFAGAEAVPQHEFRMVDANKDRECPMSGTHVQV